MIIIALAAYLCQLAQALQRVNQKLPDQQQYQFDTISLILSLSYNESNKTNYTFSMAIRDVRNFKFLKEALIRKFRFPNDKSYKGIFYEPITNPYSIFGRTYHTFRELIKSKHLNLNQYQHIEDPAVLRRLYLNLEKDPNLKFLNNPESVVEDSQYQLSNQYYLGQPSELIAVQQAEGIPIEPQTPTPRGRRSVLLNPQIPASVANLGKNLGSSAGIFTKKGLGGLVGAGGNLGIRIVNGGLDKVQAASSLRNRFKTPSIKGAGGKIAWALLGALFLFMFISGMLAGIGGPTTPPAEAPGTISPSGEKVNLAQCSFSGVSGNLKAGNPSLADMVSDISAKVGVPGPLVMGILRIESIPGFTSKDPNYLTSDYDATPSSAGAIGIAQFLPSTFSGIFLNNKDDIVKKFGKTNDNPPRITSIKDSIMMAAYKIKDDKNAGVGSAAAWDETAARLVARRYYGACSYEGATGSYCEDLAQSFSNCKSVTSNLADVGQIGQIVQGIQNACTGAIVVKSNLSCLNSVNPPLPKIVDDKIRESTLAYNTLQCVGYVKALASWINKETLNDHGVANAYDYQAIPPTGYSFVAKTDNKDIMIGDIGIWNNAPNGHVAYVVEVDSLNRFLVTEASWGPQGYVRMDRHIDKISEPGFQGFARKQL